MMWIVYQLWILMPWAMHQTDKLYTSASHVLSITLWWLLAFDCIAGWLYDITQDYSIPYIAMGAASLVGSLLALAAAITHKYQGPYHKTKAPIEELDISNNNKEWLSLFLVKSLHIVHLIKSVNMDIPETILSMRLVRWIRKQESYILLKTVKQEPKIKPYILRYLLLHTSIYVTITSHLRDHVLIYFKIYKFSTLNRNSVLVLYFLTHNNMKSEIIAARSSESHAGQWRLPMHS